MKSSKKDTSKVTIHLQRMSRGLLKFFKTYWLGTLLILCVTLVFFWPIITRIDSYSPGGDAMFNAWTLARDQHCILRENCSSYANGNIFYPNKNSMLYSETQLSAGLITLPLHFINENPLLSYNVWTIISFFLAGWFMYLLAKYLSHNNEFYSILAGLAFAFGPIKMAEIVHLQNLSIFYLPLIVLLILKYLKQPKRWLLIWLFIASTLFFFSSWYQMVFGLAAIFVILTGVWLFKISSFKSIVPILIAIVLAVLATLPLAKEYVSFSGQTHLSYGIGSQNIYSASAVDYFIPYKNTLLGNYYYKTFPTAQVNSYSPDGDSYVGISLYLVAAFILVYSFIKRKTSKSMSLVFKWTLIFLFIAAVGFVISLGPFLKFGSSYLYHVHNASGSISKFTIALPFLFVDALLPQIGFIRAIDRSSILVLFGLCCILGLLPVFLSHFKKRNGLLIKYIVPLGLLVCLLLELAPTSAVSMSPNPYYYNMSIPKAYKLIHDNPKINNIVVLTPDYNYPNQQFIAPPFYNGVFEQILWAGYDNKNTFNGYSGYFPKTYNSDMSKFNNFQPSDLPLMRSLGIQYILVDKLLSSSDPNIVSKITSANTTIVYQDSRYCLIKI